MSQGGTVRGGGGGGYDKIQMSSTHLVWGRYYLHRLDILERRLLLWLLLILLWKILF